MAVELLECDASVLGIAPSDIENLLKSSSYISEAVLFADGRKFPSALIEIDFDTVSDWARQHGIVYTGFTSLSQEPRVFELIGAEIEKSNAQLARVEQIKKFRIIPKELDPEEGDTTPTRKVKRRHMYTMFQDLVEGMYRDNHEARTEGMEISRQLVRPMVRLTILMADARRFFRKWRKAMRR